MKKIFFVLCILGFVLGLGIGSLYATTWTCNDSKCDTSNFADQDSAGDIEQFKTSKNVEIRVNSSEQSYAAVADHYNGDRVFGASSDSTKIYYKSKSTGVHYSSDPSADNSDAFKESDGWESL